MEISSEYLADLLIGIAKSQAALIDAMERAQPGFRNNHAVPLLSIAANLRAGDSRMIDLPSRILLRMQGRTAFDNASVKTDIERLASLPPAPPAEAPAAIAPAVARAAAAAPAAPAAAAAAPAAPAAPAAAAPAAKP